MCHTRGVRRHVALAGMVVLAFVFFGLVFVFQPNTTIATVSTPATPTAMYCVVYMEEIGSTQPANINGKPMHLTAPGERHCFATQQGLQQFTRSEQIMLPFRQP